MTDEVYSRGQTGHLSRAITSYVEDNGDLVNLDAL